MRNPRHAVSRAKRPSASRPAAKVGRRRARRDDPIAVIDIGSNSVRLVVYEHLSRSPTPVFNEKTLCGLGRDVQSTGLLAEGPVEKALASLRRFRALCRLMKVGRIHAIATAACRDAKNGPDFIVRAERICGVRIEILSGSREAYLSALGVIAGNYHPDGLVGDLGGGSLELVGVKGRRIGAGKTMPLGGLALQDISKKSLKRAAEIVTDQLADIPSARGKTFYAVGGTWRALARIHIIQSGHPLHVMHGYEVESVSALDFVRRLRRLATAEMLADIETVADARRPLLTYAALVMEHIIRVAKPKRIVFSTHGVREGLLHEMLPARERAQDGLIAGAEEINRLRSRAPTHGADLIAWTDSLMRVAHLRETPAERRLRHAACLLTDISWRAHPDHRGEQALDIVANGNLSSLSHAERAFLGLTVLLRYDGLAGEEKLPEPLRDLMTEHMIERARVLAVAFRVAFIISAAQPGVLKGVKLSSRGRKLVLAFNRRAGDLAGDRISGRFKQLARLVGRTAEVKRG